jgi:hypothetical protein
VLIYCARNICVVVYLCPSMMFFGLLKAANQLIRICVIKFMKQSHNANIKVVYDSR